MTQHSNNNNAPFISAEQSLPEITIKAVVLAIVITAILAAANAYLALKLGQTISASIPAAVIAMGALRFFKNHNILENNIVQTAASAGEGVAAAVSFVLPALIIIGFWQHFHYWQTVLMIITGGLLGVLFSIPLRRVMLNYPTLRFPEGTAIGNVLKASASGTTKMKHLVQGGIVGSAIALCQTGFKLLSETLSLWAVSGKTLFGTSLGFSPALLAAGFIVGMQACVAMLVGLVLTWGIGIPLYTYLHGLPVGGSGHYEMAMSLRSDYIRYIGVGTMLLGGAWTIITLVKPIVVSLSASVRSLRTTHFNKQAGIKLLRTEYDIPIGYILLGSLILILFIFIMMLHAFHMQYLQMGVGKQYGFALIFTAYIVIGGFVLASVCAYLSGLVGMTNNPLSGLMLGSVLITSLLLLAFLGPEALAHNPNAGKAIAMVLVITTVVAIIVNISGENMQDLKAGQIVGATPWKQQVMLLIGVVVAALVIGPVLELLFSAYGIGGVFPRPGMDSTQMLSAPQAGLMAAVAQGALGGSLPWSSISIGMGIAFAAIFVDEWLKKHGKRLPILAIGLGIYLPPEITTPVIMGGILNHVCRYAVSKRIKDRSQWENKFEKSNLIACGLVAGAALMGVVLAVPFVLKGSSDALSLASKGFAPFADGLAVIVLISLFVWLYKKTVNS